MYSRCVSLGAAAVEIYTRLGNGFLPSLLARSVEKFHPTDKFVELDDIYNYLDTGMCV